MSEIAPKDEKLLQLLTEHGLITTAQASRVKNALMRGVDMIEAIHATPLVEPLKLASMQSLLAAHSTDAAPLAAATAPSSPKVPRPFTPIHPELDEIDLELDIDHGPTLNLGGESFELRNLGPVESKDELDLDLATGAHDQSPVELDEDFILPDSEDHRADHTPPAKTSRPISEASLDDLDLPEEHPSTPAKSRSRRPAPPPEPSPEELDAEMDVPASLSKNVPLSSIKLSTGFEAEVAELIDGAMDVKSQPAKAGRADRPKIPELPEEEFDVLMSIGNHEEFSSPLKTTQTYSTSDDEGINLIRHVNEIIGSVLDQRGQGFLIDSRRTENNLILYNPAGGMARRQTIESPMIDKVINRLKVMSRLEPWRRQKAQKGIFKFAHKGINGTAYVQAEPMENEKEVLIVRLESP